MSDPVTNNDESEDQAVNLNEEQPNYQVSGQGGDYSLSPELQNAISDTVKEEIKKEIAVDKASLFTVFGIFASIVTFVSVEIQILKTICDFWNVAGFSLIFLASLLMFILLLDYIGRGWRNDFIFEIKNFPWIISMFIIAIFVTGLLLAKSGNEKKCTDELIYQRYEKDFNERQVEIEGIFDNEFKELREDIKKNTEQIQSIKNTQS